MPGAACDVARSAVLTGDVGRALLPLDPTAGRAVRTGTGTRIRVTAEVDARIRITTGAPVRIGRGTDRGAETDVPDLAALADEHALRSDREDLRG